MGIMARVTVLEYELTATTSIRATFGDLPFAAAGTSSPRLDFAVIHRRGEREYTLDVDAAQVQVLLAMRQGAGFRDPTKLSDADAAKAPSPS